VLIFEEVLNQKQENYECYKGYKYPLNTFIITKMEFLIFFVRQGQNDREKNDEKCCKNQLTCTEHMSSFGQS